MSQLGAGLEGPVNRLGDATDRKADVDAPASTPCRDRGTGPAAGLAHVAAEPHVRFRSRCHQDSVLSLLGTLGHAFNLPTSLSFSSLFQSRQGRNFNLRGRKTYIDFARKSNPSTMWKSWKYQEKKLPSVYISKYCPHILIQIDVFSADIFAC